MVETETIKKKKTGADVVVDSNSSATITKKHEAKPGEPFLAPPGAPTSKTEEEAVSKGEWQKQ